MGITKITRIIIKHKELISLMGDDFYKINVHNTKLHIFIISTVNNKKNNQKQKQTKAPKNNHRIKRRKTRPFSPSSPFSTKNQQSTTICARKPRLESPCRGRWPSHRSNLWSKPRKGTVRIVQLLIVSGGNCSGNLAQCLWLHVSKYLPIYIYMYVYVCVLVSEFNFRFDLSQYLQIDVYIYTSTSI